MVWLIFVFFRALYHFYLPLCIPPNSSFWHFHNMAGIIILPILTFFLSLSKCKWRASHLHPQRMNTFIQAWEESTWLIYIYSSVMHAKPLLVINPLYFILFFASLRDSRALERTPGLNTTSLSHLSITVMDKSWKLYGCEHTSISKINAPCVEMREFLALYPLHLTDSSHRHCLCTIKKLFCEEKKQKCTFQPGFAMRQQFDYMTPWCQHEVLPRITEIKWVYFSRKSIFCTYSLRFRLLETALPSKTIGEL